MVILLVALTRSVLKDVVGSVIELIRLMDSVTKVYSPHMTQSSGAGSGLGMYTGMCRLDCGDSSGRCDFRDCSIDDSGVKKRRG